jgi:hypothetical protein
MELRLLVLRDRLDLPEHLGRGRLVEADLRVDDPDGLEHPGDAERSELSRQHRLREGRRDERLRRQVVDLVRLRLRHRVDQRVLIEEVAVQELDLLEQVRHALEVADAGAAHETVNPVAVLEQVLGEIRAVLPVDSGDERRFHSFSSSGCSGGEYTGSLPAGRIRAWPHDPR